MHRSLYRLRVLQGLAFEEFTAVVRRVVKGPLITRVPNKGGHDFEKLPYRRIGAQIGMHNRWLLLGMCLESC